MYMRKMEKFLSLMLCLVLAAAPALAQDTHPLNYLRVNATLAQYDEFISCYGIRPGDGMYIAPENRVAVW